MALIWIAVDRFNLFGCTGNGAFDVTFLIADESLLSIEPAFQKLGNRCARGCGVRSVIPLDRQCFQRSLCLPPGIGDDGHGGIAYLNRLLTPFMPLILAVSKRRT